MNSRSLMERRANQPSKTLKQMLEGWGFIAPATLLILGLSIFPALWALFLSLQKWNGFTQQATFVGLDNYTRMISDREFWDSVQHSLFYVILFVPTSVFSGLFLAVALNRKIKFIGLYRTAIFVPFVVSAATTGVLTNYLFDPQYGIMNNIFRVLGLPQQGWLNNPNQAMVIIAIMSLWGSAAFTTVIYLAALQDLSPDLIEAASLDGASRWQTFWAIIWPELIPVTIFITIWQFIGAIQLFDLVYTTTRGGPLGATQTIVYYLWETAFHKLQFGYGSAIAYGLFALTLLISIAIFQYSREKKIKTL